MSNKFDVMIKLKTPQCMPEKKHESDIGFDLKAYSINRIVDGTLIDDAFTYYVVSPGERVLVNTGVQLDIAVGLEGQIRARSGLALKHGIQVVNSPGTIDPDYRGDVGVILLNTGKTPFCIQQYDRIAQLVIAVTTPVNVILATELSNTVRGVGGFGSTGI